MLETILEVPAILKRHREAPLRKEREEFLMSLQHNRARLRNLAGIRLVEVIAGANCTVPRSAIVRALGSGAGEVSVIKARAGFTRFEVVVDQRGFSATA